LDFPFRKDEEQHVAERRHDGDDNSHNDFRRTPIFVILPVTHVDSLCFVSVIVLSLTFIDAP
jgi:hypothetical protein